MSEFFSMPLTDMTADGVARCAICGQPLPCREGQEKDTRETQASRAANNRDEPEEETR